MANVISENIVNLVKDQISDQMLEQIKGTLGNEGPKTSVAIGSFLPAILSGVTNLAGSSAGADKLYNTVNRQDEGMLDNIGSMMREGQSSAILDQGSNLLGSMFGSSGVDKLGSVLSAFSGVSRGNSTSLMGILAPLVIGVIKRKFMGGVSNASGLASLLQSQKPHINAAMPSGLADQLQSSGFLGSASGPSANTNVSGANNTLESTATQTHTASQDVQPRASWKKYIIPAIGVAVVGLLALRFLGGSPENVTDAANDAAATATEAATGAATEAATATGAATEAATDAIASVDIEGVGTQFTDMFGGATDALSGITDVASAEAAVPALQGIGENLGGLTSQLEKIPESARGPLTSIVSSGVSALQPIVETAYAIPGDGPILEPIVNPIMETLQGIGG